MHKPITHITKDTSTGYISFVFMEGQSPAGLAGDVNGDATVDVSDVNAVINIILGNATASDYPGTADINGSGDIDVSDVNQLINIILTSNP